MWVAEINFSRAGQEYAYPRRLIRYGPVHHVETVCRKPRLSGQQVEESSESERNILRNNSNPRVLTCCTSKSNKSILFAKRNRLGTRCFRLDDPIRNRPFFMLTKSIFIPPYSDRSNYTINIFKTGLDFSYCFL